MRILKLNKNNTQFIHNRYLFYSKNIKDFKKTFNNLPIDKYHSENKNKGILCNKYPTRLRRYSNYDITINDDKIKINHNPITTFQQNVEDKRKNKREFELIENIYHPIILDILNLGISYTKLNEDINDKNIKEKTINNEKNIEINQKKEVLKNEKNNKNDINFNNFNFKSNEIDIINYSKKYYL